MGSKEIKVVQLHCRVNMGAYTSQAKKEIRTRVGGRGGEPESERRGGMVYVGCVPWEIQPQTGSNALLVWDNFRGSYLGFVRDTCQRKRETTGICERAIQKDKFARQDFQRPILGGIA